MAVHHDTISTMASRVNPRARFQLGSFGSSRAKDFQQKKEKIRWQMSYANFFYCQSFFRALALEISYVNVLCHLTHLLYVRICQFMSVPTRFGALSS
jgi:hypothetical protein